MSEGFNWTAEYAYEAQQLCAYETVELGYSSFCDLFTWQEWLGFEQVDDIQFQGQFGFSSPTGRAVGVGYVEEVVARLKHHLITSATATVNVTLDSMESTFPTNQVLNLDFSHDTNIASVLTAFGLTQFNEFVPADKAASENRTFVVSHMEPFACHLDIRLIDSPKPLRGDRNAHRKYASAYEQDGSKTQYVQFLLNQRTIPLGKSFAGCGQRSDGWCELGAFLEAQADALEKANFEFACYGEYEAPAYGAVTDGNIFA